MKCALCPRKCYIDRSKVTGFCGMGDKPVIAKACLHFWEEPCISGKLGSGTVFFSGCNLGCKYCQNYNISQENYGQEISIERLGEIFLELQEMGAHNINLVNPSHFILCIKEALEKVKLKVPVVYNSSAFDTVEGIELMNGLVNVYLPDLKYISNEVSLKYSGTAHYFEHAAASILEMYKQVEKCEFDENGIIKKGMIIRHLILPGLSTESVKILNWIKDNLPDDIHISLMSQYTPFHKAAEHPEINRRITGWEYEKIINHFNKLGFKNGYIQKRSSASEKYIPEFNLEGV